ncbi:MAG: 30S ribosomal protein S6 [Peptoniphilus sp.]|nr:30S ribosomal protein S6 [Peptoniphilus sp.]MDD7363572.1 30S ribosomal protein S6 [Bacillota bacterium]MDY6044686.1 30S ribosomal protein S6 [Peptoniphilus sp.]
MNNYEVILMFYPDAESERREKQYTRLKNIIADNGTIKSEDEWGTRKLAYEIEDYKEAYYALVEFDADPEIIKEFSRIAGISDTVMRHMVVRVDE